MKLRRYINYSNVVASLALFVALGTGSAYAITTLTGANIKDGTLTGRDIKNGYLTGADLAPESVTGNHLLNGTVRRQDIANASINSMKIEQQSITGDDIQSGAVSTQELAPNAVGPLNIAPNSVDTGDLTQNARQDLSVEVVIQQVSMLPSDSMSRGEAKEVDISCPEGKRAIGGGAYSEYWIQWGKDNNKSAAGGLGANPKGRPILDASNQSIGWHLTVGGFSVPEGLYTLELGPEPVPPIDPSLFKPMTAYALCAA